MPQDFRGDRLRYRVAIIEDPTYPMADHRARDSLITVAVRDTFSRHMLMGINLFTLSMFQQFPDTLGIRSTDYMYAAGVQPLVNAGLSALQLAQRMTAPAPQLVAARPASPNEGKRLSSGPAS